LPDLLTSKGPLRRALTTCCHTPDCLTCGMADVAVTMKQYVQTGLEAGRRVATTLAELIIGGSLLSAEIGTGQGTVTRSPGPGFSHR
jgi:hypothetical protein